MVNNITSIIHHESAMSTAGKHITLKIKTVQTLSVTSMMRGQKHRCLKLCCSKQIEYSSGSFTISLDHDYASHSNYNCPHELFYSSPHMNTIGVLNELRPNVMALESNQDGIFTIGLQLIERT